jgi:hypothetical protein
LLQVTSVLVRRHCRYHLDAFPHHKLLPVLVWWSIPGGKIARTFTLTTDQEYKKCRGKQNFFSCFLLAVRWRLDTCSPIISLPGRDKYRKDANNIFCGGGSEYSNEKSRKIHKLGRK